MINNNDWRLYTGFDDSAFIAHYGVGHDNGGHSGRYPWGSGDKKKKRPSDRKISKMQGNAVKGLEWELSGLKRASRSAKRHINSPEDYEDINDLKREHASLNNSIKLVEDKINKYKNMKPESFTDEDIDNLIMENNAYKVERILRFLVGDSDKSNRKSASSNKKKSSTDHREMNRVLEKADKELIAKTRGHKIDEDKAESLIRTLSNKGYDKSTATKLCKVYGIEPDKDNLELMDILYSRYMNR